MRLCMRRILGEVSRLWTLHLVVLLFAGQSSFGQQSIPRKDIYIDPDEIRAKHKRVDFAPHVVIDWTTMTVEVAARVCLREGPLELLACNPNTREHESILIVPARPLHIYQAMGLIGLEPGSPVTFNPETEKLTPPEGDGLTLLIRYEEKGFEKEVPAQNWLKPSKEGEKLKEVPWVFAGSRVFEERFLADQDGTVICVVNFESALIAVGESHTAENANLWLVANTDEIPPVGTDCTILIRHDGFARVFVGLDNDGVMYIEDQVKAPEEVLKYVNGLMVGDYEISLVPLSKDIPFERRHMATLRLVGAGIERGDIVIRSHARLEIQKKMLTAYKARIAKKKARDETAKKTDNQSESVTAYSGKTDAPPTIEDK